MLDAGVFTLDEPGRKISVYSEDSSKAETYSMSYTVSLSLYPSVASARLGAAFSVVVIGPCSATFDNCPSGGLSHDFTSSSSLYTPIVSLNPTGDINCSV